MERVMMMMVVVAGVCNKTELWVKERAKGNGLSSYEASIEDYSTGSGAR
jgi:hypothetical protein